MENLTKQNKKLIRAPFSSSGVVQVSRSLEWSYLFPSFLGEIFKLAATLKVLVRPKWVHKL